VTFYSIFVKILNIDKIRGTLVPEVRDSVFTEIQQTFNTLESQEPNQTFIF